MKVFYSRRSYGGVSSNFSRRGAETVWEKEVMTMEYMTPQLTELGSLVELTLGMNGTAMDSNSTAKNAGTKNPKLP